MIEKDSSKKIWANSLIATLVSLVAVVIVVTGGFSLYILMVTDAGDKGWAWVPVIGCLDLGYAFAFVYTAEDAWVKWVAMIATWPVVSLVVFAGVFSIRKWLKFAGWKLYVSGLLIASLVFTPLWVFSTRELSRTIAGALNTIPH